MYTKQDFINSFEYDVKIINHLIEKIPADQYGFKLIDNQRTVADLIHYLSSIFSMTLQVMREKNMELYKTLGANYPLITPENAVERMNAEVVKVKELLTAWTDEDLNATISMFGGPEMTKGQMLVDYLLQWAAAYKMQLFLYIKQMGIRVGTSNVWGGMDMPEIK